MSGPVERIHATCVAAGEYGLLVRGPSGAGKSDLALRLICSDIGRAIVGDRFLPIMLVADDQVVLTRQDGALLARAPDGLRGLLEVRGVGIVPFEGREQVAISLVVDLCGRGMMPRMPDARQFVSIAGKDIPSMSLDPFENSAPLKALLTLRKVIEDARENGSLL